MVRLLQETNLGGVPMNEVTIKNRVSCSGTGLHTGVRSKVIFHPAPGGTGIVFLKKSGKKIKYIQANVKHVVSTDLATSIGSNGDMVGTVEHLLAALRGLSIDNLFIEVQGDEIPILDGSSKVFVELLESSGFCYCDVPKRTYMLKKKIMWGDLKRWIKAYPSKGFRVDYIIDFAHPMIGQQMFHYQHRTTIFKEHIAPARTFGFLKDVCRLKEMGLALGGSLDNAVVFDDEKILNPGGLRFADEPVRHKILDFIGDLSLIGGVLEGYFQVYCSGHAFNSSFVKYLLNNRVEFLQVSEGKNIKKKIRSPENREVVVAN